MHPGAASGESVPLINGDVTLWSDICKESDHTLDWSEINDLGNRRENCLGHMVPIVPEAWFAAQVKKKAERK
jgi:hypothetical protein